MKILFKTNQNSKINNTTNNILDLNSFWNQFEKLEKKVKETPQKMEAGFVVNGHYQNIKRIVNKDKVDEDFKEIENADFKDFCWLFDGKEWHRFGGSYWDPNYTSLMAEVKSRGLDQETNFNLISYLKNRECTNMMEANQISIHIES